MIEHQEPTKYFVIAGTSLEDRHDDYRQACKANNLPPMATFCCDTLRQAIDDVTKNVEFGIECVVCCTDLARTFHDIPETVPSVASVGFDPLVQHRTISDTYEDHRWEQA